MSAVTTSGFAPSSVGALFRLVGEKLVFGAGPAPKLISPPVIRFIFTSPPSPPLPPSAPPRPPAIFSVPPPPPLLEEPPHALSAQAVASEIATANALRLIFMVIFLS